MIYTVRVCPSWTSPSVSCNESGVPLFSLEGGGGEGAETEPRVVRMVIMFHRLIKGRRFGPALMCLLSHLLRDFCCRCDRVTRAGPRIREETESAVFVKALERQDVALLIRGHHFLLTLAMERLNGCVCVWVMRLQRWARERLLCSAELPAHIRAAAVFQMSDEREVHTPRSGYTFSLCSSSTIDPQGLQIPAGLAGSDLGQGSSGNDGEAVKKTERLCDPQTQTHMQCLPTTALKELAN
ncbi:hypothetical protein AOLI_G00091400 [Acnodon oligacanthus]